MTSCKQGFAYTRYILVTFLHAVVLLVTVVTCQNTATPTRFGYSGPSSTKTVEEMRGFPFAKHFFRDYVYPSKPLKMSDAATSSLAYKLWQDEFFLSLDIPNDDTVIVETKKKEDRQRPSVDMHFQEFVRTYNSTEQYMVNPVPDYLGEYVLLPGSLHCPDVYEELLVENIMWFSSGGTKSVVHTDSVENIICVYRGEKKFILVDPKEYAHKVDIDHPEGAYSSIDVDNVDYQRYPGLREIEYHHAELGAGDCLYIPFKWIHQVRSYGRNIAVNVWWDHYGSKRADLDACPDAFDQDLTLNNVDFQSFSDYMNQPDALRDQFTEFSERKTLDLDTFIDLLVGNNELDPQIAGHGYKAPVKKMFTIMDINRDGVVIPNEVLSVEDLDWEEIRLHLMRFEAIMDVIDKKQQEAIEAGQHDEL